MLTTRLIIRSKTQITIAYRQDMSKVALHVTPACIYVPITLITKPALLTQLTQKGSQQCFPRQ